MTYITNYGATSHSGAFSVTTGGYVFAGTVSTDKDNNIKSITCDITKSADNSKVGSLSMYYSVATYSIQEAVAALIDTVLGDLHTDLSSLNA